MCTGKATEVQGICISRCSFCTESSAFIHPLKEHLLREKWVKQTAWCQWERKTLLAELGNVVVPRAPEKLVKRQAGRPALDQVRRRGTKLSGDAASVRRSTLLAVRNNLLLEQQLWGLHWSPELGQKPGLGDSYHCGLLCIQKSFKIIIWELFLSDERRLVPAQRAAELTNTAFSLSTALQCCSCDNPT